jgi:predicted nucleic acid-binding protein
MIVFDTDAVSELLRRDPLDRLHQRVARANPDTLSTTAITIGELAFGAARAVRQDLYARALLALRDVTVLDFDRLAAEAYGDLRAVLERKGTRLADPDLRIAAIVVSRGATLVTGNMKHFAKVPDLKVENWLR